MHKAIVAGCLFLIFSQVHGQLARFPIAAIPEELKKNVNAIVRQDRMTYTIFSKGKGKVHAYFAVTILNAKAKHLADFSLDYDKLSKITLLTGSVYDAAGKLIKKLKTTEIIDQSYSDGAMFSDIRIKSVDLTQGFYPYTVEFEYITEYNYLYNIDGSTIIPGENISVENASYELIFPEELAPRYRTLNISSLPVKSTTSDGKQSLLWRFEKLLPLKLEPYAPARSFLPRIMVAPSIFEYAGYEGNMSSWKQYGQWQLLLNKDRDLLPEETRVKVKTLIKGATSEEEKVRIIYEYLQSKTRYVYIGLGIGGLQPFEASVVDKMGYGDCKALSNYMVSMLKEAGIKGYYATVMAGENAPAVIPDFPSHQGNHVIVAVPNDADTLWLECTSQTNPFGYIGTFTDDRKALLITEDGGKLVNTKKYTAEQNVQSRSADVFLELSGNAKATVKTTYSGLQYEDHDLNFVLNKQDMQKKWVESTTQIPIFDIVSFSMTDQKQKIPSATVKLNLNLQQFATVNGKRIFITPNLMNRSTHVPEKVEQRKSNVHIRLEVIDNDTIRYHIPENIYPEFLPEPIKITSRYGEYESTVKLDAGSLVYTRRVKMNKGEFPADSYTELIDFYKSINKADNMKMVFLNKT
jgi:transglutaminase-like putative cysteine protease